MKIVRNFKPNTIMKDNREYIIAKYEVHIGPHTKIYCSHIVTEKYLEEFTKLINEINELPLEEFFNKVGLITRSAQAKDNKLFIPKADKSNILDKYTIN